MSPASDGARSLRWWPGLLILALGGGLIGAVWWRDEDEFSRQNKIMAAALIAVIGGGLLVLWLSFAARLTGRGRRRLWMGLLLGAGLFLLLFRFRGRTGDLWPRFEWRFRAPPAALTSPQLGDPEAGTVPEEEFPQYLGPGRDGRLPARGLAEDWERQPPVLRWSVPVGAGWSGFAVADGKAVTQELHGAEERVVCRDLASGRELWSHGDTAEYRSAIAGDGPRATPTLDDGRVFTLGATGRLNALRLEDGSRIWTHDVVAEHGARVPEWGMSGSPLRVGDLVVVSAGGPRASLVAYGAEQGELRWQAGTEAASYSSPFLTRLLDTEVVVILNHASVTGHDPRTGEVLFELPWSAQQVNVTQPLPWQGRDLLVSAGYGRGTTCFRLARSGDGAWSFDRVWSSRRLKSKFSNWVLHGDHVYAFDDGTLCCFDPVAGERVWKDGRFGHGQMILAGDQLLVQTEDGEVLLVHPSPQGLDVRTRFAALEGTVWNPPALVGRWLLVRHDRQAALYELPGDLPPR